MKTVRKKVLFIVTLLSLLSTQLMAENIKGIIRDKSSKEPLTGATVQIVGTNIGVIADLDGNYNLAGLKNGTYNLEIKYVSYKTIQIRNIKVSGSTPTVLNFEMEPESQVLGDVTVVARKNLEGEKALLQERQKATLAIENMGAKEMSLKGVSSVADGVKKITGVSLASAGQLIVRGLGDRYSTTTLNGLPIASPNPDNKLIPLDIFPTSTVKNITVSKVYEAGAFADYSGAHVDIGTRENTGEDFFSISINAGGKINTLFKDFYSSDRKGSLFSTGNLNKSLLTMNKSEFEDSYVKNNDPFGTSFSISKNTSLPVIGGSLGVGKSWKLNNGQKLSLLASVGISNDSQILKDAYVTTLTAQGTNLNEFSYDKYTSELKMAGLASVGYTFRKADRINYTLFYARNAVDNYMRREGYDSEGVNLIGSNSVFHAYTLLNNQLLGHHEFGKQWDLNWSASYGETGSDEPDRRQVMFRKDDAGALSLFKLNKQETMRYYGELDEKEVVGDLRLNYKFGESNKIKVGGTYKDKDRDFTSARFYYNLNAINPTITDIYDTDGYLNQSNLANGTISITRDFQPKYTYYAGSEIAAAFAEAEYYPIQSLLVSLGVRYEHSTQWVRYWDDASNEKRSELNTDDFFPALNMKYNFNPANSLRLSASRTVTRPSFIEMAPFLYKESYGSSEIRGNENLKNGYNYNIDLRYEFFPQNSSDMFSITGYYKKLESPIERVQESSGGSAVHSFRNADNGMAAGVEIEIRKEIIKNLRFGINGSYMYTDVKLPEGEGIYTDSQRQLQGASPYLINADLSYTPNFGEERRMSLAMMYNVQGPRIHSVGIYNLGNVEQQALHTFDFVGNYEFNKHFSAKVQLKDLLNSTVRFKQDVPSTGKVIEVESFKPGMSAEIGFTYKF